MPRSNDPNYHLTTDLADKSIAWLQKVKAIDPDKPFFLYVAPGATHAPHQAPKEWIDKFKGQFDMGWDGYREQTFARQKQLGVVPANAKLTPRPADLPAWDSLNADQKRLYRAHDGSLRRLTARMSTTRWGACSTPWRSFPTPTTR